MKGLLWEVCFWFTSKI